MDLKSSVADLLKTEKTQKLSDGTLLQYISPTSLYEITPEGRKIKRFKKDVEYLGLTGNFPISKQIQKRVKINTSSKNKMLDLLGEKIEENTIIPEPRKDISEPKIERKVVQNETFDKEAYRKQILAEEKERIKIEEMQKKLAEIEAREAERLKRKEEKRLKKETQKEEIVVKETIKEEPKEEIKSVPFTLDSFRWF